MRSDFDEFIRQFVVRERAGREMLGQHRAAFLDRGDETVARAAVRDRRRQRRDRVVPHFGRNLLVDAGIRDDLGIAFRLRRKDQTPVRCSVFCRPWAKN